MAETNQAELTIGGDMEPMGRAFLVTAGFLIGFIVVHLFRGRRQEATSKRMVMRRVKCSAQGRDSDRELAIIGRLGFRP